MRVFVPFDGRRPKTRLSSVLDERQRRQFARVMLDDVLDVLRRAGHEPTVLATVDIDCDSPVRVDERELSTAVNAVLDDVDGPVGVVMADLPLATVEAIDALFARPGDVVIAPGLGGGTNALVVRTPEFRVDYHGASFRDHARLARERGLDVSVVDSFRLSVDVDEPRDLIEVLLHGQNGATEWLRAAGITIDDSGDRPALSDDDS